MSLAVLNPGGKDPFQAFDDGAGPVDDRLHAPVNYHAYAACVGGAFHSKVSSIPDSEKRVLLLLRRDLKASLSALRELKAKGKTVAISWKESGLHQVAQQLAKPDSILLFKQICALADGALSSTRDLLPFYMGAGVRFAMFIPTPYPISDARWDFSIPPAERKGVLVGTREFDVPSRNHLIAIFNAMQLGEPITVFNQDGRAGRKRLEAIGDIQILEGRLPYSEYLRVMARHKLVFQVDRSAVPGQVAGDALLCRVPCVGGDSAIERIAFPDFSSDPVNRSIELAHALLANSVRMEQAVAESQQAAKETVSYEAIAGKLDIFFKKAGER
jgi:hypothetical protein